MTQCQGTVINPKNARFGERCRLSSKRGSDYCNVHGGNHTSGVGHPETLERRCIARNRSGVQCERPPIHGGVVCPTHGGASKFVKAKAQERLARLVDPAITVLSDLMLKDGTSDQDRARYALAILDRVGMSPGKTLEIGVQVKPWEVTMQHIIKSLPEGVELPVLPEDPDIEDAEILEDEPSGRDLLPRIIPPREYGEKATIRIGSPLDRDRSRHADEADE